jgi:uncharacterized membrane protein
VCARGTFEAAAGPLRVLAVLAYGATIFQVAQSLQVPAYAPHLLLAWALGGLAFSYATRALAALTLSVAVLGGWLVWAVGEAAGSDAGFVVGLAFAMPLAAAVAALHDSAGPPALRDLGDPWWVAAACFGLIALFAAAIPDFAASADDRLPGTTMTLVGLACVVLGAAAVVRSPSAAREVAAAFVLAVVAVGLVLVADEESAGYVLAACGAFLVAAVAVAALGASRSLPGLTNLAFLALLVFVAVQSFGLMADILSGAALLLTVGVLLLVIGLVLDRGRRALLREAAR